MKNKLMISNIKDYFEFNFDKPFYLLSIVEERIQTITPGEDIEVVYQNGVIKFKFSHYNINSSSNGNVATHRYLFDKVPF